MSFGYVVRPRADRDIDEIADYLTDESGLETGLQFLAGIYETFSLLASNREMGWRSKIRHPRLMTARTFPASSRFDKYLIFYQPFQDRIEILRVLHGSQNLVALFNRQERDTAD